ncbi:MAG: DNA mismatch repair protein MutS [Christensenellales bacterium]|jgi:DNA mismatch repair protein MutS
MGTLTPMMQQYFLIKERYGDCILMFRLGDFYEMFFEDAKVASQVLEIALTGRDCGLEERAPMCGIPHHAANAYINKLVSKGYKVAICEQLSDPSESKGIVERDVVRIVTPGTVIDDGLLDEKNNNFIVSICASGDRLGLCAADVSTGLFEVGELCGDDIWSQLSDELERISPSEIITNDAAIIASGGLLNDAYCYADREYYYDNALDAIKSHFKVAAIDGLGLSNMTLGINAAGALISYLGETQKNSLEQINRISLLKRDRFMLLDAATRRNLELTRPMRGSGKKGTLLWLLDKTHTAMGGRLLKAWIEQPLCEKAAIDQRLEAVSELVSNMMLRDGIGDKLSGIYDLERLATRFVYGTVNARDCLAVSGSISALPDLKEELKKCGSDMIKELCQKLDTLEDIHTLISGAIAESPPVTIKDGGIIKDGYNAEVDELRAAATHGREWIAALEAEERELTGIKNLKIGYNKVFGYYLEVTKSNYGQVPYRYIRKQTLANSERFVTPQLKEMEEKLLGAEEKLVKLEYNLFCKLRDKLTRHIPRIQACSAVIAQIDALQSLACVSFENGYCRPNITTDGGIEILSGRHPVVEKALSQPFVPNNTSLDMENSRIMIITGPNMAGKSTYLRQVALITLMAHIGSFVPAKEADICVTDRIFTRVGASDDLAMGQSTFMVEMSEMANILNNATSNSLLILDEIGRGTGTFDGLSIAWAAVEHIADKTAIGAKTLFATHYHELGELEGLLDGVLNYRVSVREMGDNIIFLRKIVRGGTDKSFGIQVAKLAGVPDGVIERAKEILTRLQRSDIASPALKQSGEDAEQMSLFRPASGAKIIRELANMNINTLTPLEALNILSELCEKAAREE